MKILFIIIAVIVALMPIAVFAIDLPDTEPTVDEIRIYRNLRESGDKLMVIYANIPYTTTPSVPVTNAFVWRLIGTDDVTELGATVGYSFQDYGYGYNVYSMYFSPTDNFTWGETDYTLRLSGMPSAFDDPPVYNYSIGFFDYYALPLQSANQAALVSKIIELAANLDQEWGRTGSDSLIFESESGTVLSIYGETVFRGAIYGVQSLAPQAFRLVVTDIVAADRSWTLNYSGNLSQQYAGTWIAPAKTGGGTLFGVGYDLTGYIIAIGISIGLIYLNSKITRNRYNAFLDIAIILVAAPRIDLIPLSFTALICAIAVLYEGTKIKSIIA